MKLIFALSLCFFFYCPLRSNAQSDSARYADCQGTYFISTPSFPVRDIIVSWKDSTLAFAAGVTHGRLTHLEGDRFSFSIPEHEGTVTFKKDEQGTINGILILMDGEPYEGIKKAPGKI